MMSKDEGVCFESSIIRSFAPMLDFTAACVRFYAERRIFTVDAILAMGMDVPHDGPWNGDKSTN